jgi:membrane protein implicated in regulation of membrane protease activity
MRLAIATLGVVLVLGGIALVLTVPISAIEDGGTVAGVVLAAGLALLVSGLWMIRRERRQRKDPSGSEDARSGAQDRLR